MRETKHTMQTIIWRKMVKKGGKNADEIAEEVEIIEKERKEWIMLGGGERMIGEILEEEWEDEGE